MRLQCDVCSDPKGSFYFHLVSSPLISNPIQLECSEELGDIIKPRYPVLARLVFQRAGAHGKVIQCFGEAGLFHEIISYAVEVNFQPDYISLLRNILRVDPEKGLGFARMMVDEKEPLADLNSVSGWEGEGLMLEGVRGVDRNEC